MIQVAAPICKDCRHYADFGDLFRAVHACVVEGMTDPVDGGRVGRDCRVQRHRGGPCGEAGKLFEPREAA